MSRTLAFGFLLVFACLARASAQAASPDPYAIYSGARTYWLHQHYPARIGYTISVEILEGGTRKVEHYSSAFDAIANDVEVNPLSDYEIAHPASGRGLNFGLPFVRLSKPDPPLDFIGVPSLAPNYSFAIAPFVPSDDRPKTSAEIVRDIRAKFHDLKPTPPPAVLPNDGGLPEIAVVSAAKHRYLITLLGVEQIDGAPAYHLALKPLGNPHVYRLRDIWVDTATYATRRLINAGNFVDGPWPGLNWTVDFASVDGALYIADEHLAAPVAFRGLRYLDTLVSFSDVHPADKTALDDIALYRPNNRDLFAKEPPNP
ncbi:MAG: hypothetical protein M3R30_03460 [Candidatus Eremiobacteraeota bacterium]|nr:hypothetical protein [Candidatus Eremiobacteraeota bacterium]